MYAHYQEWEISGMNRKEFAESNGLVISTFYDWCKKFSQQVDKEVFDKSVRKRPDEELNRFIWRLDLVPCSDHSFYWSDQSRILWG